MLDPVSRYVDSSTDPDVFMFLDVVEKLCQSRSTSGTTRQAVVNSDCHHLRKSRALSIKKIERLLQVHVELLTEAEALAPGKSIVVRLVRVGYDQVRLPPSGTQ